jgi:hypothetical protein
MNTNRTMVDLGFTRETFPAGTHMCLIYSSDEERGEIIARYLESGLKTGERVAYFADALSPDEVRTWLAGKGVALPDPNSSGQLSVSSTESTYHPTGVFVPEEMLETLKAFHGTACADHYTASRLTGEMSWALKGIPGSERLMEYESRVNEVLLHYPVTAICQYDVHKFSGAMIFECLKVHPFMIVHGQIVRNPYYLDTKEYLQSIAC